MRSKYLVTLSIGVENKEELLIGEGVTLSIGVEIKDELLIGEGGVLVCNIFGSL